VRHVTWDPSRLLLALMLEIKMGVCCGEIANTSSAQLLPTSYIVPHHLLCSTASSTSYNSVRSSCIVYVVVWSDPSRLLLALMLEIKMGVCCGEIANTSSAQLLPTSYIVPHHLLCSTASSTSYNSVRSSHPMICIVYVVVW
jgi:ABC-type polysaccharide transport system permease subunit